MENSDRYLITRMASGQPEGRENSRKPNGENVPMTSRSPLAYLIRKINPFVPGRNGGFSTNVTNFDALRANLSPPKANAGRMTNGAAIQGCHRTPEEVAEQVAIMVFEV